MKDYNLKWLWPISSSSSSFSFKVHILPFTEVGLTMIPKTHSIHCQLLHVYAYIYINTHTHYTNTSFGSPLLIWSWVLNGRMPLLSPTYLVGLLELMVGNTFIEVYRHLHFKYHLFISIYDIVCKENLYVG